MDLNNPDQMAHLRKFASFDDIEGLASVFSGIHSTSLDNETFKAKTAPILHEAIQNDSYRVVDFLLDHGAAMHPLLFQEATRRTSYRALESFLNHGFDINTSIDTNNPPAIA